jgi:hypothetical protein
MGIERELPTRLDEIFGQRTGSSPWSEVNHDLVVALGSRLFQK